MAIVGHVLRLLPLTSVFLPYQQYGVVTAEPLSNGCMKPASGLTLTHNSSIDVIMYSKTGGGERSFRLHVPATYASKTPAPLILAFHGKAQNASAMEIQTQLSSPDFNSHAIVAYPQGINNQWTGDPEAPLTTSINDIDFSGDLLDYIEDNYCIEKKRIYATGFSNGGGLTDLIGCKPEVSSRLAAIAISSGAFYTDSALKEPLFSHCTPGHVMPVMEFHGSKDPVEHYDGKTTPDGESYALPEWLKEWAVRNGCDADIKNQTTLLHDGKVEKSTWSCGGIRDVVIHYYIHGFGHGWPTTTPLENDNQRYGPTYFNATPIIMEFFGEHRLSLQVGARVLKDEL